VQAKTPSVALRTFRRWSEAGLLGLWLLFPLAVHSQTKPTEEPSLEELLRQEPVGRANELAVSTASRVAQSSSLAPGVTHVVTRQDIARLGLRRLGDVLELLPGIYLRQDALFTYVGVRGIGRPGDLNSRVLFLLDGMRLNENLYDAGQIDEDLLVDLSMVERVEFTPGPGSALYGNNAFLGVVNIITQRADQLGGTQLRLGLSERGGSRARASIGRRSEDGSEWWLAASHWEQQRTRSSSTSERFLRSDTQQFNWDRAKRVAGSWRHGGFALRGGAVDRVRGLPAYVDYDPDSDLIGQATDQTYIRWMQGSWEQQLAGRWDVQLSWSAQQLLYRFDQPFQPEPSTEFTDRFESLGRWSVAEARIGGPIAERHELLAGIEWQYDQMQRFRSVLLGEAPQDSRFKGERWGLFVQDEWRVAERQRLVIGLRHDHSSTAGNRISPRLAYVWSPTEGRSLKLLVGHAFRGANRSESASNEAINAAPPPAERVQSLEMAWEAPLGAQGRYWVQVYRNQLRSLIDFDEVEGRYLGSAPLSNLGVDAGVQLRFSRLQWQASSSWQRSRFEGGGAPTNSPRWLFKSQATLALDEAGHWRAALTARAISSRHLASRRLGGYALWNVNLLWQPRASFEASLGVFNLGAKTYDDAPSSESANSVRHRGRAAALQLFWRLGS